MINSGNKNMFQIQSWKRETYKLTKHSNIKVKKENRNINRGLFFAWGLCTDVKETLIIIVSNLDEKLAK